MLDTKSDQNESIFKINDSELMKIEIVLRQAISEWASTLRPGEAIKMCGFHIVSLRLTKDFLHVYQHSLISHWVDRTGLCDTGFDM